MNTPTPPRCLSMEINDVTCSMIRLDLPSFEIDFKKYAAYHWRMSQIIQENSDPELSDCSVFVDLSLREEPEGEEEEEEEEEKDEGGEEEEDDDDDRNDGGYSE